MTTGQTDTVAGSSAAVHPRPSTLMTPDLSHLRDDKADEPTAGETVEDLELAEAGLSGGDPLVLTLLSCRFSGIFASGADLTTARLIDCCLERLSATYLHNPRSTWRTVELIGSRIGAWEPCGTDVESLPMEDYRLGFASLVGTTVRDLLIRATQIDELDLSGIDAQQVRSEGCQVGMLCLYGGSLSDAGLREPGARAVSGVGSLAGTTISSGQPSGLALLLAQRLGLRVADQDHAQSATTRSKRT